MELAHKQEPTGPASADASPATLGRYRLLESIGQGGMAEVMLAVMPGPARFNKLLVIKTIREDILASGEQYAHMFLDEARLAARLNHQNVVQTYEVGEERGLYYIAMEYLEGQPLRSVQHRLTAFGLPLEARLRILIDTAQGLHHAHELTDYSGNALGVVHRDVSPQNIFLTYDGQVKLLDFGIAKTGDAEVVTTVGQIKGKIDYMAPEQIKGDPVDRRADVFALGAIMWELLADKPLSGGVHVSQMTRVHKRVANQESGITQVVPELDAELARICNKALAHHAEDRYPTALDFARDLQLYVGERSLVPTSQQLAQILGPAFSEERKNMRARIDKALATVEHERTQMSSASPSSPGSSETSVPTVPPPGRRRQSEGAAANSEEPAPTRRRFISATRLATLSVVVGVAAWLAMASGSGRDVVDAASKPADAAPEKVVVAAAASPSSNEVPATDEGAQEETIRVRVVAAAPNVHVTLDGASLPTIPFEADVTKDSAIHKIVASAPGRQTVTQVLIFDRDREVELVLPEAPQESAVVSGPVGRRPRGQPAAVSSSEHATSTTRQPSDAVEPGQALGRDEKSKEHIDEDDPYR